MNDGMASQRSQEGRQAFLRSGVAPEDIPAAAGRFSTVSIPWRPKSAVDGQNARIHWHRRHQRNLEVATVVLASLASSNWPQSLPDGGKGWRVTFTVRQKTARLMDSDGLVGCLKHARDCIAAYLGVDDGPAGPEWVYIGPERGPDETRVSLERTGQ